MGVGGERKSQKAHLGPVLEGRLAGSLPGLQCQPWPCAPRQQSQAQGETSHLE